MPIRLFIVCCAAFSLFAKSVAQEITYLSLDQVIHMAQEKSLAAQSAKHTLLAAQWQYRYFQANYRPTLTLTSSPSLNKEINKITMNDGTSAFVKQNQLNTDVALEVRQNITLTGGALYLKSALARIDEFERKTVSYSSIPITIGYRQELFGYNSLKWDRRIEPLKYHEAKKNYHEAMELVAATASNYFFSLYEAKTNLELARLNLASADTLYRMAQGRYQIGTINENDMLQLEVNRLNEETACMDAEVEVKDKTLILSSYLGFDNFENISLTLPESVPDIQIPVDKALELAMQNGSDPIYYQRLRTESRSRVAQARANAGLRADIYLQFGLSQTGENISDVYHKPLHQQYASLTLSLPILDWGRGKGQVKVAQSQRDLTDTQSEQGINTFRQNVIKLVMQFNMQARKVDVARRTSELASNRYEITRRLYIAGRNTILDLNVALSEKDTATRQYISSIKTFWMLYYTIRSMTGTIF